MAAIYSSGSTVVFKITAGASGAGLAESTYGTPITTFMRQLRLKPSKLTLKKDTYTTDEVRSDRGISDVRHGMKKVEGTLEGDLMLSDFDDLLAYALQDADGFLASAPSNWSIRNGVNLQSFGLEQGFTDINQFRLYKGVSVAKMKISIKPGAMVGISFDVIGQDAATGTATNAGTTVAPSSNSPVSYAGGSILEGGTAIAYITGLDFELDNGIGQVGVIGSNVAPAVFNGRSSIKGTGTALFKDQVMLNKFINETESSIQVALTDPTGASITFTIPRIKYTGGDIAPPKDGATIITLPFEGLITQLVSSASSTSMAVTAQVGPGSVTFTKVAGTSFITEGYKPGMILTTSGLTTPANNGDWLITSVAAQVLTCQVPTGVTTVLQAAGAFGNAAGAFTAQPQNISIVKS